MFRSRLTRMTLLIALKGLAFGVMCSVLDGTHNSPFQDAPSSTILSSSSSTVRIVRDSLADSIQGYYGGAEEKHDSTRDYERRGTRNLRLESDTAASRAPTHGHLHSEHQQHHDHRGNHGDGNHHHEHHDHHDHHEHHHTHQQRSHHRRRFHRHLHRRHMNQVPELKFSQPEYVSTVPENLPIQTSVLQVSVASPIRIRERDLEYSVSDKQNFGIDSRGVLYTIRALDFEKTKGSYMFHVNVLYKGDARLFDRRTAKAVVRLYVNDSPEPPRFESDHYFFSVPELAPNGASVGTVRAVDDDNDLFTYVLQDDVPPGKFRIDSLTGEISVGHTLGGQQWTYDFHVAAVDDSGHVTIVPVTVYLIATIPSYARLVSVDREENNHKPFFRECSAYDRIHVKENMTEGTPVLMVLATDDDRGNNGVVSYSLLNDFDSFTIQSSNQHGQISTTRRLDRDDKDKNFLMTVEARDGASKSLQDSCSFNVIVEDINDNQPIFNQKVYEETISTDHLPGTQVLRVTATDMDSGPNADISYQLQGNPRDLQYFSVDADTGIITLTRKLQKDMANKKVFEIEARAADNGSHVLWSTADIRIQVVSSDELPPTVISQQPLHPAILENTTENTDVLTICARSNLADSSFVYFTLLNGNTSSTNADGTFAIRRLSDLNEMCTDSSGVTVFVATRNLDYESVEEYFLTLQIVNDHNARIEKRIQVNILDINDNAPLLQPFDGAVNENVHSTLITTIKAHDKDTSPQFRQLRYSFDRMASSDVRSKFALKTNGELWTIKPLDREEFKQYKIPITVNDGVQAHERTTIYWITVGDLNDVAPMFDQINGVFEVELPENREVRKSTRIKLPVIDPDVRNKFDYQIIEGNSEQKFMIDAATGDILVNKVLDFDHPVFDRNFTLRVRVDDGANAPAETNVVIAVTNVNDLQPVFEQINYTFTVTENTDCNITFGKVSALDPDLPHTVNQNILYYLSPVELRNFTIDSATGNLSIKGCLDRESAVRGTMTLYPRANDEGGKGHDADPATVHLIIRDINDNHPHIHKPMNSYAKIMENMDPEDVAFIPIQLEDEDGGDNGCPCTMEFDPNTPSFWLQKFDLILTDESSSSYELRPLVALDREERKVYHLPFLTRDLRGRMGIRHFTLEVGDENDSPMTDGYSKIKVYNYQGQFPAMVIGSVHVTDLDDHDLDDKIFEMDATTSSDVANHFQVDLKSGNITMLKGTPAGVHVLRVKVYDRFREESAVGEVKISVVDLNLKAVLHSGSLTLADITAHQMLQRNELYDDSKSLYDRLKEQIARIHKISMSNVDVFSMRDVKDGVHIRYNCHSSPYYTAAKLDGLMMKYRQKVSKALSVDIVTVDMNSCLNERDSPCGERKSCQHTMRPNLTSPLVIASSTATMVGVDIVDEYTCDCGELEPLPSVCFDGFCYNGGTCSAVNNTLKCQCLDSSNYGPRCELLNARFEKSFAWYEPLKVCDNSTFFISFKTNEANGVIVYTGPIVESPWHGYPKDFLYIFLKNWVLETYLDLGSGTLKVAIPIERNNARAFEYAITWNKRDITFEVFDCGINTTLDSLDPCKRSVRYPKISGHPSYLLNVQGPLQVGGFAPMVSFASLSASYRWNLIPPSIQSLSGCILEMSHNYFIYDLNATDYGMLPIQPCDAPRTSRVVLGQQSIIIIFASLLCLLILVLLILCLARRGRKTVSYPDLDRELVKETMGGTDLEAFGEKDVTHFDLKFLQVTPDGYVVKDDEPNLPDVTQDARQCRTAPIAKIQEGLSIGDFINTNVKKMDQHQQDIDDVRHYNISGDEISAAASLSSLASGFNSTTGSSKSDVPFDYKNDWCQRFEKIAQIYGRQSDQEEDSEYEFPDIPNEPTKSRSLTPSATKGIEQTSHTLSSTLSRNSSSSSSTNTSSSQRPLENGGKHLTKKDPEPVSSPKATSKVNPKQKGEGEYPKDYREIVSMNNINKKSVETWC